MLHPALFIITHHYSSLFHRLPGGILDAGLFWIVIEPQKQYANTCKTQFLVHRIYEHENQVLIFVFCELFTWLDILIWIVSLISSQACRWTVLWKTWVRRCKKHYGKMRKLDLRISVKNGGLSRTWIYFLPESNIGKLRVGSDEFPFGVFSGANC